MDHAADIARLEARIAALEAVLRRRSEELREILRSACAEDRQRIFAVLSRPLPTQAEAWDAVGGRETYWPVPAEVLATLNDLWTATGRDPDGGT